MCTMMKSARNPVFDWHINGARAWHGCRVYERSAGIKPVIKAVKSGLEASSICRIGITAGRQSLFAPSSTTPRRRCRPCHGW